MGSEACRKVYARISGGSKMKSLESKLGLMEDAERVITTIGEERFLKENPAAQLWDTMRWYGDDICCSGPIKKGIHRLMYDKAHLLVEMKRYDDALSTVKNLRHTIKNCSDLDMFEANIHLLKKDYQGVLDVLENSKELKPNIFPRCTNSSAVDLQKKVWVMTHNKTMLDKLDTSIRERERKESYARQGEDRWIGYY
jgi:hypothetical protein